MRNLSLNERRLMEWVLKQGEAARIDLAEATGMTAASVTRLTAQLLDLGLLQETPDRTGAPGQPRKILRIPRRRFVTGGLTFSLARMTIALVDIGGELVASTVVPVTADSAEAVAIRARRGFDELLAQTGIPGEALLGVGCSVPGNFGVQGHELRAHALFPAFEDGRAAAAFNGTFGVPIFIENDGTAAALGEYVFGGHSGAPDPLFLIHIGHGVGGGAVIGGRPYRGWRGNACLPGVLFPYELPRPSGQDLMEMLAQQNLAAPDLDLLDLVPPSAEAIVHAWIERAGDQLGEAVRVISGLFDPALIVIGGRLPKRINTALVDRIASLALDGPSRGLQVARVAASTLGPAGGAIGAACLPIYELLLTGAVSDKGSPYLNGRKAEPVG